MRCRGQWEGMEAERLECSIPMPLAAVVKHHGDRFSLPLRLYVSGQERILHDTASLWNAVWCLIPAPTLSRMRRRMWRR